MNYLTRAVQFNSSMLCFLVLSACNTGPTDSAVTVKSPADASVEVPAVEAPALEAPAGSEADWYQEPVFKEPNSSQAGLTAAELFPGSANYFVATSGNDANPGSRESPFRTVQRAANVATAGQTVLVAGGIYYERNIAIRSLGTPTSPITFRAVPGQRVVIDHGLRVANWTLESGGIYKGLPAFPNGFGKDQTLAVVVNGQPLKRVNVALTPGTWSLEPSSGLIRLWAVGSVNPQNAEVVIVNSSDATKTGIWINSGDSAVGNIILDGFTHRGADTAVWGNNFGRQVQNKGLTVKNCVIAFNWDYAFRLDGWKGANIVNCDVHHNGLRNYPAGSSALWPHSIIGWDGDDVTVIGSKVRDNYGEGVGPFSGCSNWKIIRNQVYDNYSVNIYIDTSENDMLVDGNLVYNTGKNGRGSRISPDGIRIANEDADLYNADSTPNIENVKIINNIVLGVGPGITSFRYAQGSSVLRNSVIANNTVLAVSGFGGWDTDAIYLNPGDNVDVANNIVFGGRVTIANSVGAGVRVRNNLVSDSSKINIVGPNVSVTGTVFGNPMFNLGTGFLPENYRLKPGSPARNAGVVVPGVATDFFRLSRPVGAAFDIGATEER